jgi:Spy/CpxP family protein refolding chaperone
MKLKSTSLLTAFALAATVAFAQAQAPDPNAANNDPNRQRVRGNPEEFRKMMAERLKAQLKVTDEEWTVLQPLIEKVTTKQRDASGSRFGGGRPPGGGTTGAAPTGGGTDPSRPERAGTAEREALRTALESEGTSNETIKDKLAAVREIHKKAVAELAAAREDLQKVLTVRQEAVLVSYGILE